MRVVGRLIHSALLEHRGAWPYSPIDWTADCLQAVLADLRHLQGFLGYATFREEIDREDDEDEARRHDHLCRIGTQLLEKIRALADELEKELEAWEGKTGIGPTPP